MPILKISKRDRPFLIMDKRPLGDTRLSWKAKMVVQLAERTRNDNQGN